MADGFDPDVPHGVDQSDRAALAVARAERDAWAQELFECNRFAAELVIARQALADELGTVEACIRAEAHRHVEAARDERDRALAECAAAVREREQARAAQNKAEARLARVTGSTTWRLTAPIRFAVMALLGRARGDV